MSDNSNSRDDDIREETGILPFDDGSAGRVIRRV